MKILFMTDTHITAKAPVSRLDDIQEVIKLKMKEIGVLVNKEKIELIIHGGDMFHRPEVSNKFTGEVAKIIRDYNIPFYVVPGNHDLQGQNEESLPHSKLGLLSNAGVVKILNRKNPLVLNDNGFKISIEGQEYHPDIDKDAIKDYEVHNKTADFKILAIHSMLLDHEYFKDIPHTQIKDVCTQANLVLSGHYHPGFKTKQVNNTLYMNPGSLLRIEDSNHKPKVIILNFDDGKLSYNEYELKVAKDSNEVFSKNNLLKKGYNTNIENFNKKLKSIRLDDVNILNMIDEYIKTNPEDLQVVDRVKSEIVKIQKEQIVDDGYVSSNSNVKIDKVEINNFMVHKNLTVNFTDGLNAIIGSSMAGKSTILRAIQWVLYDTPKGNYFITTGKKKCTVKLYLSNGYIIERHKTKTTSGHYILYKPDGTKDTYKGFSNNIPIDIINSHQMPEVFMGGKRYRLNVASQLESPFMVAFPSDEKMTMIGSLVDADRADEAKKAIMSDKRSLNIQFKKVSELKEDQCSKLSNFNNLHKIKIVVDKLEIADAKLDRDEMLLNNMKDIFNTYNLVKSNLDFLNNKLNNISVMDDKLIADYKRYLDTYDVIFNLRDSFGYQLKNLQYIDTKLCNLENIVDKKDIESYINMLDKYELLFSLNESFNEKSNIDFKFNFDIDNIKYIRNEYVDLMKTYSAIQDCRNKHSSTCSSLNDIQERILIVENDLIKFNDLKNKKLIELKSKKHICETCGSEVTADKLVNK